MNARSTNRARQERDYAVMRGQFLGDFPRCDRCLNPATEVHHARGRQGWRLLYVLWWVPLCHGCHQWVTDNPTAAIYDGYSLSRLGGAA